MRMNSVYCMCIYIYTYTYICAYIYIYNIQIYACIHTRVHEVLCKVCLYVKRHGTMDCMHVSAMPEGPISNLLGPCGKTSAGWLRLIRKVFHGHCGAIENGELPTKQTKAVMAEIGFVLCKPITQWLAVTRVTAAMVMMVVMAVLWQAEVVVGGPCCSGSVLQASP